MNEESLQSVVKTRRFNLVR